MKKIFVLILCFGLSVAAGAQSMYFFNLPSDPARLATASTGEDNPALMFATTPHLGARVSYGSWGAKNPSFEISARGNIVNRVALGIQYKTFGYDAYDVIDNNGRATGTFKPSESDLGLKLGVNIAGGFSIGVGAHICTSKMAEDGVAKPFALDASVAYCSEKLRVALGAYNLGGKYNYGAEEYSLPTLVRADASYLFGPVRANAELDYLTSGAVMAGVGTDGSLLKDHLHIRAGFHYGDAAKSLPSYISAGLGCQFIGITLDAAYLIGLGGKDGLGNTFRIALGYAF